MTRAVIYLVAAIAAGGGLLLMAGFVLVQIAPRPRAGKGQL